MLERQYSFDENGQHTEDNGSENMIIHGDNLDALKALLPRYEGRVKCIYIDPPYNTGNEGWAYNDPFAAALPWEVRDKVNTFHIIPQYRESVDGLLIPQFFQVIPQSLFTDGDKVLLSKEMLADGFTLKGKAYDIDFAAADDEIVKVDVETGRSVPRAYQMEAADQRYFKEYFSSLPPESRVRQCKDMMIHQLDKLNMVDGSDLRAYVNLIVDGMDREQLAATEKAPLGFAAKIRAKIETLLEQHYKETFFTWLDRGKIVCEPHYCLPSAIHLQTVRRFTEGHSMKPRRT